MAAGTMASVYPVRFDVDYPEQLSRWKTLLRIVLVIPALVVSTLVTYALFLMAGAVFLSLLFRKRYPRAWFDFILAGTQYSQRVNAYGGLLTDRYPSTYEEQSVHVAFDYPDADRELNRWLPLVKWLLAIPHLVVLWLLSLVVSVTTLVAWFVILVTGRYPRGLFDLAVGVARWNLRVQGYAFVLVTDRYPPFRLEA
jgi:hypothetical protein